MRLFTVLLVVVALSGCAMGSVTKDDKSCSASYFSVWKSEDALTVSACGATGAATNTKNDQVTQILTDALLRGLGSGK
jgi:hypothetical protein